ncbi:hypothetical protein GUITHDRAFT_163869 [Guillardia theta CCMP2712]|uniref:Uncharacterized protein n=2 Tax=Guillardia theta TaxID=55529 RepID=L1J5W9_GUITC|nr:hypothetical protein GUITHDRAFT_163869 [Guillardia theta CCMP2712]EKX43514.1 hypothetical protein GUITHDRAFT_163869 [Guillardia theta CCMP2712]|eukprot:XP_005830494.1 hypothetical protein GUITHDRAFT_163869 [Guillardia theta CCMP2712]
MSSDDAKNVDISQLDPTVETIATTLKTWLEVITTLSFQGLNRRQSTIVQPSFRILAVSTENANELKYKADNDLADALFKRFGWRVKVQSRIVEENQKQAGPQLHVILSIVGASCGSLILVFALRRNKAYVAKNLTVAIRRMSTLGKFGFQEQLSTSNEDALTASSCSTDHEIEKDSPSNVTMLSEGSAHQRPELLFSKLLEQPERALPHLEEFARTSKSTPDLSGGMATMLSEGSAHQRPELLFSKLVKEPHRPAWLEELHCRRQISAEASFGYLMDGQFVPKQGRRLGKLEDAALYSGDGARAFDRVRHDLLRWPTLRPSRHRSRYDGIGASFDGDEDLSDHAEFGPDMFPDHSSNVFERVLRYWKRRETRGKKFSDRRRSQQGISIEMELGLLSSYIQNSDFKFQPLKTVNETRFGDTIKEVGLDVAEQSMEKTGRRVFSYPSGALNGSENKLDDCTVREYDNQGENQQLLLDKPIGTEAVTETSVEKNCMDVNKTLGKFDSKREYFQKTEIYNPDKLFIGDRRWYQSRLFCTTKDQIRSGT